MKTIMVLLCVLVPQVICAEIVFFDILKIEALELVSATKNYELSENSTIKNRTGESVPLSEIQLPAKAKGDFELKDDQRVLNWVVLTGRKNNRVVPE